jgi:hypothetical protein
MPLPFDTHSPTGCEVVLDVPKSFLDVDDRSHQVFGRRSIFQDSFEFFDDPCKVTQDWSQMGFILDSVS